MHRQLAPAKAFLPYFPDDQETDAAKKDQPAGDQVEQQIVPVGDQVLEVAQDVKAGVVEGGDGVEQADAQRPDGRVVLHKDEKAERRAGQLKDQGGQKDSLDQPDQAAAGIDVGGLADQGAALQVDALAHGDDDACAHRGDAQAAHLDQPGQDGLAQGGEGVARVDGNQTGDADGAGGGVQRVNVPHLHALLHAEGHDQQHRPQQNDGGKAQRDQSPRRLPPEKTNDFVHNSSCPAAGRPALRKAGPASRKCGFFAVPRPKARLYAPIISQN